MSNICNGRPSHPLPNRCAPQTWRYADGLRAALAFCDRVAANYDDEEPVDEMRWHLRRALNECGACEPTDALAAIEARAAAATPARERIAQRFGENPAVIQHATDVVIASAADVPTLLADLRSLRAHVASEPERVAAAVDAALAAERGRCVAVCRARAEKRRGEADAETAAAEYGEAMESRELARDADALADAIAATRGAR